MHAFAFPSRQQDHKGAPPVSSVPAWAQGLGVGKIIAIAGTSGAGGAAVDAFCGWAWKHDSHEAWVLASGGHHDSYDNRVCSIKLSDDAPAWTVRKSASAFSTVVEDQPYGTDNLPSSRHTYSWTRYVPQRGVSGRLMLFGCYGPYGTIGSTTWDKLDGFDPATNQWDAPGTWAWPASSSGYWGNGQEGPGGVVWAIWGSSGTRRYDPASDTWTTPTISNLQTSVLKFPWAYSSAGNYMFGLCWGNGEDNGSGVTAIKQVASSSTAAAQTAITFNASAALTQFQADAPGYAGMDFCPDDGCFYHYDGRSTKAGRIYRITPNDGTVWDMGIVTPASGSASVPASSSGGINSRFTYVTLPGGMSGFLFQPSASSNLHFMRTA